MPEFTLDISSLDFLSGVAKNRSKKDIVKNKNLNFQKFLSPFYASSYKNPASKFETFFGSNASIPLIIEAGFFHLPPRLECLAFCGGLPERVLECRNRGSRITSNYQS